MTLKERPRGAANPLTVLARLGIERMRTGAVYSPVGAGFWANPYPMYSRLRQRDPIHRSAITGTWVVSSYGDVAAVLRDPRFLSDKRKLRRYERASAQSAGDGVLGEQDGVVSDMTALDPPGHTRLRALVSQAFSPRSIGALRPRIQRIVPQSFYAMAGAADMDIVRDLAVPLPVTVMAEMMGLPLEDHDRFRQWADDLLRGLGYARPDELRRTGAALGELTAYLTGVAEERRQNPGDDLISALLIAEEAGDRLTMAEVVTTCLLLLNAGYSMITNFIGSGLLGLFEHPDQMEALRRDPSLMGNAVEELLRYDAPAQATWRFALEDVQLGDRTIEAGQQVLLLLGAANRDPEKFSDPDRLDITRDDSSQHLSFSHGIHYCIAAPLARLETHVALGAVNERFPKLRLATERVSWEHKMFVRSLEALPVAR